MLTPTKKQLEYLQSVARECRIMKRDFSIGLPGNVSESTVNACIAEGWALKEWQSMGTLADGRTMSETVYRLTPAGEAFANAEREVKS